MEALLRAAVDAMLDPQALLESVRDDGGRIVDFVFLELNPSACAYLQRSAAELLGARLTEVLPELPASGLLAQYAHAIETGEQLEVQDFPLFSHRYHAVRRFDVRAMRAGAEWLSVVWRDITDRHRARQFAEIEFSEAARDLVRISSDALLDPLVLLEAVPDPHGKVVDFFYREVNQAACDYLCLSRAELIGRGLLEMSPGVVQAGVFADYVRCLKTGEPVVHDDLTYDNEILVDTRRYDLRATRATASSISLTWRDVTERYRASQRIMNAQQNYRLIAENAGDLVLHIRDSRFAWVSPSVSGEATTKVVEQTVADALGLRYTFVAAWITCTIESDLEAVGMTAAISRALADAGISCNVLAGSRHDHLLVPWHRRDDAVAVLARIAD